MCTSCTNAKTWLGGCRDGRGPSPTRVPPRHEMPQYPQVVRQQYTSQPNPQAVAGPCNASNASVYPGSNFARTPTRASDASTASDISVHSAEQALSIICSNHSLRSLNAQLARETQDCDALKIHLEREFQRVDPNAYRVRKPWHQGMVSAHDRYKKLAIAIGTPHDEFEKFRNLTKKNTTPEQHIKRARLAIDWGKAAKTAAVARLEFLKSYRDAYPYGGIQSHINEAATLLQSAQDALRQAENNYNNIWVAAGRSSNPAVFQ